jgi:S1-C subfamily serine protease
LGKLRRVKEESMAVSRKALVEEMVRTLLNKMDLDELNLEEDDEDDKNADEDEAFDAKESDVPDGVVRVYCTHSQPIFGIPWQRGRQEFSTSSGFVISGRRILTNAHAVEYGTLIQVKKRQSERKYLAEVVAVGKGLPHNAAISTVTVTLYGLIM